MGAGEIEAFLTHLAVERNVSASTQNQALSALLFLYKEVLQIELPWLNTMERAKKLQRLPTVLTVREVNEVAWETRGHDWIDGKAALRHGDAVDGVRAAAGQGCGF
jgi:site-specific recombinase XerD